jgi:hypothetical protein
LLLWAIFYLTPHRAQAALFFCPLAKDSTPEDQGTIGIQKAAAQPRSKWFQIVTAQPIPEIRGEIGIKAGVDTSDPSRGKGTWHETSRID